MNNRDDRTEIIAPPEDVEVAGRTEKLHSKRFLISFIALVLLVCACAFIAIFLNPGEQQAEKTELRAAELDESFSLFLHNMKSDVLGDLTYIKKQYKIPENDTVAPKPNPSCFGTTTDPAVIRSLLEDAGSLLDGQDTVWSEDVVLFTGAEYNYYLDDSILVISWKQLINGKACTISEVVIADGSQLKRKIAMDTYGSEVQPYASQLAAEANAVVAMNADFYAYRSLGITVYQRTLYRCSGEQLDTCFFDSQGDMHFVRAGELTTREDTEKYIADHDILFSTSFGPVLIENGVKEAIGSYPIGQLEKTYSRAAIGMTGEHHYLMMTINYDDGVGVAATIHDIQNIMFEMGCIKAYGLDGGQTAEMLMNGKVLNYIDWGYERRVSDIIYFATAIGYTEGD